MTGIEHTKLRKRHKTYTCQDWLCSAGQCCEHRRQTHNGWLNPWLTNRRIVPMAIFNSNMLNGCYSRLQTKTCCRNQSKSIRTAHATVGCGNRQHIIQTYGSVNRSHTNAKSNRWNGLMVGWMDVPMDRWKRIGGMMDGWMGDIFSFANLLKFPQMVANWYPIGLCHL